MKDDIIKRLNIIIALLLDKKSDEKSKSLAEKIRKLLDLGVQPSDVAKIIGKPINYVTATISKNKPKKGKQKNG